MFERRSLIPVLLLAPLLVAGKGKCGHCRPDRDADEDTGLKDKNLTPPEIDLQIVSVDPDQVAPQTPFDATVFGSGFESGARVWLGETELQRVKVEDENTMQVSSSGLLVGRYDVKVRNPNGDQATLRSGLSVETVTPSISDDCKMIRVYFAYDSSSLDAESQRTLSGKLSCFQGTSSTIKVDGHCDERGTTEYNLALGSRRASAVERWLSSQGVPPSRVRVVSYGEERPLAQGHDESAWSQNRRVEIQVME